MDRERGLARSQRPHASWDPLVRRRLPAAALLLTLALACARQEEEGRAPASRLQANGSLRLSEQERAALGLIVAPAEEGRLPDVALRYGKVQARPGEEAVVVAPVTARIGQPARVQPGDTVASGAVLLEVAPQLGASERISLGVQGAELSGQIEAARRELETLKAEAERARELAKASFLSAEKLQQAETAVATAQSRLTALLRAQGVQAQGQAGAMPVRSPVAGAVVSLTATLGAVVQPGDELARVVKSGPRWVELSVAPEEPPGVSYEVASGTAWLPARLIAKGGFVAGDGARHDRLEVATSEAAVLLPGAVVSVRLAREERVGIVVPESALVPGVGGEIVYVETADGVFAPRIVQVAARLGGKARLASGLLAAERVVVRGAMALRGEAFRQESGDED